MSPNDVSNYSLRGNRSTNARLARNSSFSSFGAALAEPNQAEQFRSVVGADPNMRKELRYRMWANLDLDSSSRVNNPGDWAATIVNKISQTNFRELQ